TIAGDPGLDDVAVETFDAPLPDELVAEVPEPDAEADPVEDEPVTLPEAELQAPGDPGNEPAAAPETTDAALDPAPLDRAAVVRELAGLFNDDERPRPQRADAATVPHRIEDDDQITKGLISRLIDGVKGL
ncbi:MAG TPA: hypothetical protein VIG64_13155, partial [Actinomycetota bacterium]